MQQQQVKIKLATYSIPRGLVCKLSGVWPTELSAWLTGRADMSPAKIDRVTETVNDLETIIRFSPFGVNFKEVESIRLAIATFKEAVKQMELTWENLSDEDKGTIQRNILFGVALSAKVSEVAK